MKEDLVSIITPVFNSELHLKTCIQSIIKQKYKNWELIIVDDFSDDNSKSVIQYYSSKDKRITPIFLEKNVGAGVARNLAIKKSKGRFIAFLDSDDYWSELKLFKQINFMLDRNIEFCFGSYFKLDNNDEPYVIITPPAKIGAKWLKFNNYIKTLTVIYDTRRIGKIYMSNERKRQDWAMWLNLLEKTKYAYSQDEALAYYRTSNESLSKNKIKLLKANYNFYENYYKKGKSISFFYLVIFLLVHFFYKFFGKRKLIYDDEKK